MQRMSVRNSAVDGEQLVVERHEVPVGLDHAAEGRLDETTAALLQVGVHPDRQGADHGGARRARLLAVGLAHGGVEDAREDRAEHWRARGASREAQLGRLSAHGGEAVAGGEGQALVDGAHDPGEADRVGQPDELGAGKGSTKGPRSPERSM